ncbi:lipopolysaccharide biosynthesis protein [Oenococcus oeni]|uniref:lipopolysaccharide biosynthesis protein n=1 Tax=Oenococcus oeni TaxID=1247 RepID=UPI000277BA83|nr:lipopolysaccharide biosynthesis protein [Oenococcus oeni]EJO05136.1 PST family polysaccharide transporter [Oenococcus oeni AWRIB548]EKP90357.1 PST family polysaccharide transporter [Oenococcus oeni DSM 20252 = AWRIB129]KEP86165.1 PST family polysaccharide transporter [Oenococcus oeni IOEB_0205]KEP87338.1 PST family polysaccharide transporter [Oenococcus oeni IOEB_0501]KGH67358.1 polysaccharide biosynthesis export protein [Oenococcus oeni IOEB_B16]
MQEIKQQFKHGVVYTAIGQYASVIANFIVTIILSRLLGPKTYGVLSIILVFLPFFSLISELGVGPAIVQSHELDDEDYSSLFKILTFWSLIIGVIFGLLGIPVSYFYDDKIYILLSWMIAPNLIFSMMSVVPLSLLQKRQEFKHINITSLFAYVVGGVVGVVAAYMGLGVYSLILTSLIPVFLNFIAYFYFSKLKLFKGINEYSFGKIRSFSSYQFVFGIINYFSRNLDNLLVGKFFGQTALGNYGKSYQMITYPNNIFTNVIVPVMQPVLANYQENIQTIKKVYLKVLRFLLIVGIPLSLYLSVDSDLIIRFLFGSKWDGAIMPFRILSLTTWVQLITTTIGGIYQSRNMTKMLMKTGIVSTCITIFFIIIGILSGNINHFAAFIAANFYVTFTFNFYVLMKKALKSSITEVLKLILKPAVIAFIAFLAVIGWNSMAIDLHGIFWELLITSLIFWIIDLIGLIITKEIYFVFNIIFKN